MDTDHNVVYAEPVCTPSQNETRCISMTTPCDMAGVFNVCIINDTLNMLALGRKQVRWRRVRRNLCMDS